MYTKHNPPSRSHLLEILKSIRPVVINPIGTFDMGMECTIATKNGIVYPAPGMFLFCGGNWPIKKLSPSDAGYVKEKDAFFLRMSENEEDTLVFTDVAEMEEAFINMFGLDVRWEEMSDSDLMDWRDAISSEGMDIVSMSAEDE
jgi:hypothetical protein